MWRKVVIICSVLFVAQCLLHYFSMRPLWLDEEYVFASVRNYAPLKIFGPLETHQAFPRVHLFLIKIFSQNFDYHVLSLRLSSLIFMLAAFFTWKALYRRAAGEDWFLALLALSFAASYRMTYYAAELKPYAMDVLTVALYALFFQHQQKLTDKKTDGLTVFLAAALPLLVFFSYAAFFVIWIVAYNFLLMSIRNRSFLPVAAINVIASAGCLFTIYQIDLKHFMYYQGYYSYWDSYFLDTSSFTVFMDQLFEGIKRLVTYWNAPSKIFVQASVIFIPFFLFALFRYGFLQLRSQGWKICGIDALALVLFLEMIAFGILHKYPFTGSRITLFFAPFVFYLIIKGIDALKNLKSLRLLFLGYYTVFSLATLVNTFFIHMKLYFSQ